MKHLHLRAVPGFPGMFAGTDGTVWRYRNFTGSGARWNGWRQMCAQVHRDGYLEVLLPRQERANRHMMIHTLIALAFHGERPAGLIVRHLDGDKRNNAPTNLAYGTQKQNSDDARQHGTNVRGDRSHLAKITDAQASEILVRLACGEKRKTLAEEFGIGVSTVDALRTGRIRAHLQNQVSTEGI